MEHRGRDRASDGRPALRRTLTPRDPVLHGIILMQPAAPMPVFGVGRQEARGRAVGSFTGGIGLALCWGEGLHASGPQRRSLHADVIVEADRELPPT